MGARVSFVRLARVAAAALGILCATSVSAQIELYHKGETKLDFKLEAVGAVFTGADSWFGESEAFLGADTDEWGELGLEPGLALELGAGRGRLFAELSGVYTKTFDEDASGLTVGIDDTSELTLEQAHLGWRVDDLFSGLEDDSFSISGGRQDYSIGTGLLIDDGGGDGEDRGGWYIGMRKAFQDSILARLKSKSLLIEAFRLQNDPRRGGRQGDAVGANFEYGFGERATFGGSYLYVDAHIEDYSSTDVYSARADWKPLEALSLSGEFVREAGDPIDADGWYGQLRYAAQKLPLAPAFSYRYAHFDGDDPATADDEQFREIAYGSTDYGSWYQGEIAGNYPLGNGNLNSHLLRVEASPREGLTLNLLAYRFTLDEPAALDPLVTDDDFGDEVDLTVDWEATDKLVLIGVLGLLLPGEAAEQWVGGDEDWRYLMLYGSYTF